MDSPSAPVSKEARYVRGIALYTLCKGLLMCLLAVAILGLLHKDVDDVVRNWMGDLGFNVENRHIVKLLARLDKVTDKQLAQLSGITFSIAGLFITAAVGLLLRQQWAKYLTVVYTASLVPIEVMKMMKHFGWIKLGLTVANIAIVAFLVISLIMEKRRALQLAAAQAPVAPPARAALPCEPV